MNQNLELILSSIENDATVKSCKEGRFGAGGRFPNITNNIKQTIGIKFYSKMMNLYNKRLSEMETKRATDAATLVAKYTTTAEEREQACLDIAKQKEMALEGWTVTANAVYNKQDSTCEVKWVNHTCVDWDSAGKCDTGGNDHFLQNCSITYNMVTGGIAVKEECGEEYKN